MPESWNKDVRGTQVPPLINSDVDTIRCVAGPGSGKTFGLVRRVERILHPEGLAVDGYDVLVVAFNRVIARQLREDIHARLKTFDYKHAPVIRTIHALCVEVIGEELRLLLPHEVDAMVYDVLEEYPAVAALYEDFYEAEQALRDHEAGHKDHPLLWQAVQKWLLRHKAHLVSDVPRLLLERLKGGDRSDAGQPSPASVDAGPGSMIAAIYARKSTEQNGVVDEQRSVARQIDHARQYAERKGWTVDEARVFVDDGISGAEFANRPGFLRLMNALKPRPVFQVLVMSEESRLGREAIETAYALKQIIQAGVRVFFYLEDRERTLDSPTDKIMLSLTAFADELEREKARQRTYDAMLRKARAGHVTGGRAFGYDNLDVTGPDGKRSHVERRINELEAAVVRRIFEMCAAGHGVRTIAKRLNAEGEPAPRAQQGRPVGWAPSSLHQILRRSLYRGQIVWNQTQKRDRWGRKHQRNRSAEEWITRDAPELRIVSEALWTAAHGRLAGAHADYTRRTGGRAWGRPVNGTISPYLLTGLAQCALCGSGISVQSRSHGRRRAHFYVCVGYHTRGRSVCPNNQALPMRRIDRAVLAAFRDDLLNPVVLGRAFRKLRARLQSQPSSTKDRSATLTVELARLRRELARLAEAIAAGAAPASVLDAIRDREKRREVVSTELAALHLNDARALECLDDVEPEVRKRLKDWRGMLSEDTAQARQMIRTLLTGRLVFTPRPDANAVEFVGQGDFGRLLAGLIDLAVVGEFPKALASPTGFEPVFWP